MDVCVIGLGYIGLPTACLLAEAGHKVTGVDIDVRKIDAIRQGTIATPGEKGLAPLAARLHRRGSLTVSPSPVPADAYIICVPTPLDRPFEGLPGDPAPPQPWGPLPGADLSPVRAAARGIAPLLKKGDLVVLESTVPPGTTEGVLLPLLLQSGLGPGDILVAFAPERVHPGSILKEMKRNDRVIGGVTEAASRAAEKLYSSFVTGSIVTTDATAAEMVKLMENSFRDVNIALANEFAAVAREVGVDIDEAIAMANRHPRVQILAPGPGVGGHCIPVDPYFLISRSPDLTPLLQTARRVNEAGPLRMADLIGAIRDEHGVRRVALMGVAYKGGVGDTRESPALALARELGRRGYRIALHDPLAEEWNGPWTEAVAGADLVVFMTDHGEYRELPPDAAAAVMAKRLVLDSRSAVERSRWEEAGFAVYTLGGRRRRKTADMS